MRLLHTADWHVGRTIRGRSRADEFREVLDEVIGIARDEGVDAMLVCGDIWDHHAPSAQSDRLVFDALRQCYEHDIQVVLLAGNHDNPRRLRALGLLSELVGVQVQYQVRPRDSGGVLTIENRAGEVARIAAVPFINEGRHVDAVQIMGLEEDWFGLYADGVAKTLRDMCGDFRRDTINILASHIFVDKARIARADGSERKLHINQTYGVAAANLPTTPQYIALGHVHEPQEIEHSVKTAYSGSLLQLDFGERGQQKIVRVIDAEPNRPVTQTPIPLTSGRPLAELRGTLDEVLAQASNVGDAHLRVRLDVERPEPGIAERVREALPNAVDVQLEYEAPEDEDGVEPIGDLSAAELFTRYYQSTHGAVPAPELVGLFEELLAEGDEARAAEAEGETAGVP